MTRQVTLGLAIAAALLSGSLHAQQPSFRSSALGVRVDALVTDGRKPVGGLTATDFELRDNGVAQTLDVVDAADVPLNVVLALDISGSTAGTRHADLLAASQALLGGLRAADRVALTTFSHAVEPRLALTSDVGAVRDALQRVGASGRTSVMDAAYVALATTLAEPGRSLVVLCTDGSDISSWLQPGDVIESAKRSNAVVYAVASADARGVPTLEELTETTGGAVLRVSSSADLRGAFQKILQEFRSRYVLAYTPAGVPLEGFHRLDVRVKRRGLTVTARPGYVGVSAR